MKVTPFWIKITKKSITGKPYFWKTKVMGGGDNRIEDKSSAKFHFCVKTWLGNGHVYSKNCNHAILTQWLLIVQAVTRTIYLLLLDQLSEQILLCLTFFDLQSNKTAQI